MLRKNCSGNVAQPRVRLTRLDLLAFLLAGSLVLAMEGLSRADIWDETLAAARKEGNLVVVLGGGASRRYRPVFQFFEDKFGVRTVVSTGGGRKQAGVTLPPTSTRTWGKNTCGPSSDRS